MYGKDQSQKGRYELIKHTENSTKRVGIECVEYEKVWKDNGGSATQFKELTMKAHGYVCIHPDAASRLIDINYSTRNDSGIVPSEAQREGEEFISSLKALSLVKPVP